MGSGLSKEGRTLVKGNSRYGDNCMQDNES